MGKGHGKVCTGVFLYNKPGNKKTKKKPKGKNKPERTTYWWKDMVDEFSRNICYILNGKALHPDGIEFINIVNGGDCGKCRLDLP